MEKGESRTCLWEGHYYLELDETMDPRSCEHYNKSCGFLPLSSDDLCPVCIVSQVRQTYQCVLDAGNNNERQASLDSDFILWKRYVTFMSSFGADKRGDPFPA